MCNKRISSKSKNKIPKLHQTREQPADSICYVLVAAVASICYHNAMKCGFVFDDISAVRDNRDLRSSTPIVNLFWNDFWGTPIHKEHSHKSYRPLCVLSFRLNYWLHELDPFGYHLINVILHVLVCLFYLKLCLQFLPARASTVAAILFASHPVHTEAVTGVVGRAEILSALFFILAFLSYTKCTNRPKRTDKSQLIQCLLLVVMATMSKEQGITVVGVCLVYEVFIVQKLRLSDILVTFPKALPPLLLKDMATRLLFLIGGALCLVLSRILIMRGELPTFTEFDNPAARADSSTRYLTYHYLVALNAWLLLFPSDLCCDWTMGTVPLVESIQDPRILATVSFYAVFISILWTSMWSDDASRSKILIMSLVFLSFPFLPASNLFFPVGFVVAERVLYIPSMGFCLLVSYGWHLLDMRTKWRKLLWSSLMFLLCMHAMKTVLRNMDWKNEYSIFMAGLKVNQKNAKLYNNVGHVLENEGRYVEALEYFLTAARIQPDDVGAYINVGRTYTSLSMFHEAESALKKAKDLLPKPPLSSTGSYHARIAPSHLNVFLNLANLISRNGSRLEEADRLYRQAISMRADYIQAYINRGDVLIRLNRTQEAQAVFERALLYDDTNADIYYNLGVVFLEQNKAEEALMFFNRALDLNPYHEQALLNSAIIIQEQGNPRLRKIAYERLSNLLQTSNANERVYFNLGMLAMGDRDTTLAEKWFRKAVLIRHDFRSALFNLALLLFNSSRPLEAVPYLHELLQHHPDHIKGYFLLGDIYINHARNLDAAEECYHQILHHEPQNVRALHNLCVVHVERRHFSEAESCLLQAVTLAPNEEFLNRHLSIVRSKLNSHLNKEQTGDCQTEENVSSHNKQDFETTRLSSSVLHIPETSGVRDSSRNKDNAKSRTTDMSSGLSRSFPDR